MSKMLRSDFRFGFEFEGFARLNAYISNDLEDFDDYECNPLSKDDDRLTDFFDSVNSYINRRLCVTSGRTHYDGSLKHYSDGYQSFEYASPIFKINSKNFLKLNNFFNNLDYHDMGINDTCGFHTHISYKDLTEKDAIWIICQIAMNENWVEELTSFEINDNVLNFFNDRYANKNYLSMIKERIIKKEYDSLTSLLNDEKYRVLRIHPQGTLEWRGPRDFLYYKDGFKKFSMKLVKIIDIIINALSINTINGISKNDFMSLIDNHNYIPKISKNFIGFSRHGYFGNCSRFNDYSVYNFDKIIKNWEIKVFINPHILLTKHSNEIADVLLKNIDFENALILLGKIYKDNKFDNKIEIYKSLLRINPSIIDVINPLIFQQFTKNDVLSIIDKYIFNNIINTNLPSYILKNYKNKEDLIDITKALLNSKKTCAYNAVFEALKNGLYDGENVYKITQQIRWCYNKELYENFLSVVNEKLDKNELKYNDKIEYNFIVPEFTSIKNFILTYLDNEDLSERYRYVEEVEHGEESYGSRDAICSSNNLRIRGFRGFSSVQNNYIEEVL